MNRFCLILFTAICSLQGLAQDPHYSQFTSSPLTLNPALTATFNGCERFTANYRNQWNSVTVPFTTISLAYDEHLLNRKLNLKNRLGFGIYIMSDKAGKNAFSSLSGMASLAFHRILDYDKRHRISFGIQGGFTQKSMDFTNVHFENQYDTRGYFDRNLPNGELLGSSSFFNFDLNAGIAYQLDILENMSLQAGYSYFHITNPKENFIENQENRLSSRHVVFSEMTHKINEKLTLKPSLLFMRQGNAFELMLGSAGNYAVRTPVGHADVLFGAWYRSSDAIVLTSGLQFKSYQFRISYDINVSGLSVASQGKGGLELSFIFISNCKVKLPETFSIPCKRF